MTNLYILTEELPKPEIIKKILSYYCKIYHKKFINTSEKTLIKPIFISDKFDFEYDVLNIKIKNINKITIKIASGISTFVDYLIFEQDFAPIEKEINNLNDGNNLKLLLEETKTNDTESRNQVFQRISKFIYAEHFYNDIKKAILYNIQIKTPTKKTDSNKLGLNILLTLDIDILGVDTSNNVKFKNINELIEFKEKMNPPNRTNTPITITPKENVIYITGSLENPKGSGNLNHDPNKGQLSALIKVIKNFDNTKDIIIKEHGVKQKTIDNARGNKFIYLSKILNFELEDIIIPDISIPKKYWKYDTKSEKNGTILLHLISIFKDKYTSSIFSNHGGGELSYFQYPNRIEPISEKNIPDLILKNDKYKEILIIEGKKYEKLNEGLDKIKKFDSIEKEYTNEYVDYTTTRWVVTYGATIKQENLNPKVLFHLNVDGSYLLNDNSPKWLNELFERVINY